MGVFLVTGGTGTTGARLVKLLRSAQKAIRIASRSISPGAGEDHVKFDWFGPQGHDAALEGVEGVYLISPPGSNDPITVMAPFIERALDLGVQRFVLLSSSLIPEGGPAMGAVHALLRRKAPEWAVLRPSWFMENFSHGPHADTIRQDSAIYSATEDGLVPFIAADDIAEVAFKTLTAAKALNRDALLTGPAALSYDQVAALIGAVRGAPVRHVRLDAGQLAQRFVAAGIAPDYAKMLSDLDGLIASGAEARTTPGVIELSGRAPRSFHDFASDHGPTWRGR